MSKYISPLLGNSVRSQAGNKAYYLGRMEAQGFSVPHTFIISKNALEYFLEVNAITKKKEGTVSDGMLIRQFAEFSDEILSAPFPSELSAELNATIKLFKDRGIEKLAVRSSGSMEDGSQNSFAGQYQTLLDVPCQQGALEKAIKAVWVSLWHPNVFKYYRKANQNAVPLSMAVILQEMIQADWSGIVFSENPVYSENDEIVIELVRGQNTKMVSGLDTPLQIFYNKTAEKIINEFNVDPGIRDMLEELVKKTQLLEQTFSFPVDVEWAFAGKRLFFLQLRPISAISKGNQLQVLWTDENVGEVIPDIVTPLSWSILEPVVDSGFRWFLKKIALSIEAGIKLFDTYKGKVYLNQTVFEQLVQRFYLRHGLKQIMKPQGRQISVLKQFIQLIKSFLAISLFNIILPGKIKRYIQMSEQQRELFRWQGNENVRQILPKIEQILQYHQHTMSLHISGTIIGEVYYQLLNKITDTWIKPTLGLEADHFLMGLSDLPSTENARVLRGIAKQILSHPDLKRFLLNFTNSEQIEKTLSRDSEGRIILKEMEQFFERYGHGALHEFELFYPRWWEDRTFIYNMMKNYIQEAEPDSGSSQDKQHSQILERNKKIRFASNYLHFFKNRIFKYILNHTQFYTRHREELKQLFLKTHSDLKHFLNDLGIYLQGKGLLEREEDIYFMTIREIEKQLNEKEEAYYIKNLVQKRRQERTDFQKTFHPKRIRQIGDQWFAVPDEGGGDLSLKGIGCSIGIAEGRVAIISNQEEFGRMRKGDILVTQSTNPGWTPLFILAAGVVTEIGGALSHSAIIAREYGLPMIAAVPGVTMKIKDGQRIRINGAAGTIEILET